MTRATTIGGVLATGLVVLVLAAVYEIQQENPEPAPVGPPTVVDPATAPPPEETQGLLYGRATTDRGAVYEGRLRWGRDQEAFWGDYFNGVKRENPWLAHLPADRQPRQRPPLRILGIEIARRKRPIEPGRRFMARFGDIARVEVVGRDVRVTLKSGTVLALDRLESSDFDDGVRVWDARGVVDLGPRRIRAVELLPTGRLGTAPDRLHGTVRTPEGAFTGFIQWNRRKSLGADELAGREGGREHRVRFDTIRSIARRSPEGCLVALRDGRERALSGTPATGLESHGIYVDDPRYGRVLISWDAFERADFAPGGGGPAYADFPPGRALAGSVTTRAGRRLAGRLVYDLDESETTDTLDAPRNGVNYTIPFGLVASIAPGGEGRDAALAKVTLHGGEELPLERDGDLGARNLGLLVFVDGGPRAEHVPWSDVERIDLERPATTYPPILGRADAGGKRPGR